MRMVELLITMILVILFSSMQVFLISLYFNGFLQMKIKKIYFLIFIFALMCFTKFLSEDTSRIIKTSIFILFIAISVVISFKGSILQKIFHTIYFSVIMLLADLTLATLMYNFMPTYYYVDSSIFSIAVYFIPNFFSLLVTMILIKLLLYFKADDDVELNNVEYLLLSIVPSTSMISIYWIGQYSSLDIFMPCLFLLVVNVCIMLIYFNLIKKNFTVQKYLMIKNQNSYYESNLISQKEIIELKHDLKNILLNLDYYLSNEQIEEARKQLQELLDTNAFSYRTLSGCIPIDAVLNSKLEQLNELNIKFNLDMQIPSDMKVGSSIDLTAIIGNLLDNAIEAILRIPNNIDKKINISLKYDKDRLIINIINTSKNLSIDFSKEMLVSEKGDSRYGVGISSIKDRVDKLKGYYDFSYNDGHFHALVVLPVINK